MKGRLPDFLIAGAPRSGTTSLTRYLDSHPSIFMSSKKEIHFFDDKYKNGLDWYSDHFQDAPLGSVCGEATPWYMFSSQAIRRIAQVVPRVKLIVSLRDPCDRLWSHYLMRRERGLENRTLHEVLQFEFAAVEREGELSENLHYLRASLYAPHVRVLLDTFPIEQVRIEIFENMRSNPLSVYQSVCRFLTVDENFRPDNLGDNVNAYMEFRSLWLRRIAKRSKHRVFKGILGRANTKSNPDYPKLPADEESRLREFFAPYNSDLEDLIPVVTNWH